MKSQRIKSLSTRYLGFYKSNVLVVLVEEMLFFVFVAIQAIRGDKLYVSPVTTTVYFGFLTYGWIRLNRNVHRVEFDEDYL